MALHRQASARVAENGVLRNGFPSHRRLGGAVRGARRFAIVIGESVGAAALRESCGGQ